MSQSEQEIVSIYPEANVYNFWTRRRIYCPLYISYKTQQGNMLQNILPPLTNDKRLVLPLKGSYYIFNIYIFRSSNSRKQDLLSNSFRFINVFVNINIDQYKCLSIFIPVNRRMYSGKELPRPSQLSSPSCPA